MPNSVPTKKPSDILSLPEVLRALQVINDEVVTALVTGLDSWRQLTSGDSLMSFDPELAQSILKQPPSKTVPQHNLWWNIHFALWLRVVAAVLGKYAGDETTRKITFTEQEAAWFFPPLPHIVRHHQEHRVFTRLGLRPTSEWWDATLEKCFAGVDANSPLSEILERLPPDLLGKAKLVLSGDANSLVGRIVLANLAERGVPLEELRIDPRTPEYLGPVRDALPTKTLYRRLIEAQQALPELNECLENYDPRKGVRLFTLVQLFRWYARSKIVEMPLPDLEGAAEKVGTRVLALLSHIAKKEGPDYINFNLSELPDLQPVLKTQSLKQIGRLSLVLDVLYADQQGESGGLILRRLGGMYAQGERNKEWGHSSLYIPDSRGDFSMFRQDIGNILFSAGLLEASRQPDRADALKVLARATQKAEDFKALRMIIHSGKESLNHLVRDWQRHYPKSERLYVARFVQQTFGLDSIKPVPISLQEISRGFDGSRFDADKHIYHLCYQEAGQYLEREIGLPRSAKSSRNKVTYRTIVDGVDPLTVRDGIPYTAWLEISSANENGPRVIIPVPGRGSFDPFGRTDSRHTGEVIGYGCSVHHAALAIALAELAALGAERAVLKAVAQDFMRLNLGVHERSELANFQVEQTLAAFERGEVYGHSDYLRERSNSFDYENRRHLEQYSQPGNKLLDWGEPRLASLKFAFRDLYPASFADACVLDPRGSWYDGKNVSDFNRENRFEWQCVVSKQNKLLHRLRHSPRSIANTPGSRKGRRAL